MITITRSALVALLARVTPILQGRTTLPVLAGTRLSVVDGRLQAEATNLDQWITTSEPCEVGIVAPEPVIVGAKRLAEITSALPSGPVTLESTARGLVVRAGKGRFTLPTMPAAEWPAVERGTLPITITLPSTALLDGLARVAKFVSTEESRPILSGICLASDARGVRLVATDSYRLLDWPLGEPIGAASRGEWILPLAVAQAARTLGGDTITIALGDRMARFSGATSSFTTRLIEGPYPLSAVGHLLALPPKTEVTVDRALLAAAVKRVGAFASDGIRKVDLAFAPSVITLTDGGSDMGSGYDEVPCTLTGDEITVRYNGEYLLAALDTAASDGAELRIAIVSPTQPTYLDSLATTDAGRRALVMPLQRSEPTHAAAAAA